MTKETLDLLESQLVNVLQELEYPENAKNIEALTKEADMLANKIIAYEQFERDSLDKAERRRIEEKRNDDMAQVERDKTQLSWKKISWDLVKIMLPALVYYGYEHHERTRMYDFEEHGRITSTSGRSLSNFRPFK